MKLTQKTRSSTMFPWMQKNGEAFALILAMGLISGAAQFWIKIRAGGSFSIMALIGELTISFSAATLCGFFLVDHAPIGVTVGCAGVAGHMGARFIGLLDKGLAARAGALIDAGNTPKV